MGKNTAETIVPFEANIEKIFFQFLQTVEKLYADEPATVHADSKIIFALIFLVFIGLVTTGAGGLLVTLDAPGSETLVTDVSRVIKRGDDNSITGETANNPGISTAATASIAEVGANQSGAEVGANHSGIENQAVRVPQRIDISRFLQRHADLFPQGTIVSIQIDQTKIAGVFACHPGADYIEATVPVDPHNGSGYFVHSGGSCNGQEVNFQAIIAVAPSGGSYISISQ